MTGPFREFTIGDFYVSCLRRHHDDLQEYLQACGTDEDDAAAMAIWKLKVIYLYG